jgi:hypothetical protein
MLRRFLIANPGASKHTLYRELSRQTGEQNNTHEQLAHGLHVLNRKEAWDPYPALSKRPLKSCAQCQLELAHFDYFDIPSLTHCPIHHTPLRPHCSHCKQPWPSLEEMGRDGCPECGIPAYDNLPFHAFTEPRRTSRWVDQVDFISLLDHPTTRFYTKARQHSYDDLDSNTDCLGSVYLPALHHHLKRRRYRSADQCLSQLNLDVVDLYLKRAKLQPRPEKSRLDRTPLLYFKLEKTRYRTLIEILDWLHHETGHKHDLCHLTYIAQYRKQSPQLFCPCCEAVSLWINWTIGYGYPWAIRGTYYLDPELSRFYSRALKEPIAYTHLKTDTGLKYLLPDQFILWLYARSLRQTFAELLRLCLLFCMAREGKTVRVDYAMGTLRNSYLEQCGFVEDGQLYYYYSLRDPLTQCTVPSSSLTKVVNEYCQNTVWFDFPHRYLRPSLANYKAFSEFEMNFYHPGHANEVRAKITKWFNSYQEYYRAEAIKDSRQQNAPDKVS